MGSPQLRFGRRCAPCPDHCLLASHKTRRCILHILQLCTLHDWCLAQYHATLDVRHVIGAAQGKCLLSTVLLIVAVNETALLQPYLC